MKMWHENDITFKLLFIYLTELHT